VEVNWYFICAQLSSAKSCWRCRVTWREFLERFSVPTQVIIRC